VAKDYNEIQQITRAATAASKRTCIV
jgi:hypothetical protein